MEGALFSTGDGHFAQGDGEVCVTAVEMGAAAVVRFKVHKGLANRRKFSAPVFSRTGYFTGASFGVRVGRIILATPVRAAVRARRAAMPPRCPAEASTRVASFDDFVGAGEDRWRDRQPERLGGVEIDDQLEPGRLRDRQIGGIGTLEYPCD
jgi:hypothetical protein